MKPPNGQIITGQPNTEIPAGVSEPNIVHHIRQTEIVAAGITKPDITQTHQTGIGNSELGAPPDIAQPDIVAADIAATHIEPTDVARTQVKVPDIAQPDIAATEVAQLTFGRRSRPRSPRSGCWRCSPSNRPNSPTQARTAKPLKGSDVVVVGS